MQIKKLLSLILLVTPIICFAASNAGQQAASNKSGTKAKPNPQGVSVDFVGKKKGSKAIGVDFAGKKANKTKSKTKSKSKSKSHSKSKSTNKN